MRVLSFQQKTLITNDVFKNKYYCRYVHEYPNSFPSFSRTLLDLSISSFLLSLLLQWTAKKTRSNCVDFFKHIRNQWLLFLRLSVRSWILDLWTNSFIQIHYQTASVMREHQSFKAAKYCLHRNCVKERRHVQRGRHDISVISRTLNRRL